MVNVQSPTGDEVVTRSVSSQELRDFANVCGLSQAAPGRYTTVFLFQLYAGTFVSNVLGDTAKVVAEVRNLEGIGRAVGTKPAEPFKNPPLVGLHKKHYLVGGMASIRRNISLGAGKKKKEFRRIVRDAIQSRFPRTFRPDAIAKNIADDVTGLYKKRSSGQKLTGNWIVFARHECKNYYLCLAEHDEGDNTIADRIKDGCSTEFPFLCSYLKS